MLMFVYLCLRKADTRSQSIVTFPLKSAQICKAANSNLRQPFFFTSSELLPEKEKPTSTEQILRVNCSSC